MADSGSLILIAALGAYHGLNPAMGWLFAVGLGLQDRERRSVLRALPPIAIGHELALVAVLVLVLVLGVVADAGSLRVAAAFALLAFGLFRFLKPRAHPRWTKMRVSRGELAWWSFLMSSAHGAGLMVAPVLMGAGPSPAQAHGGHAHEQEAGLDSLGLTLPEAALALGVHVGAMVLVMALVALAVYEKLGVSVLRRAWLNTDQVWAASFLLAGLLTLFT